jgi:GT2 family glycosyltransferase
VATHNRADQLKRLLESLRAATRPPGLDVGVIVVDNNSSDHTRETVENFPPIFGRAPIYAFEPVLGQAPALNHGLQLATGDLIGRLDDDERVATDWLTTVYNVFQDESVGFISGPYKPEWGAPPPAWLPKSYPAVIGWIEAGDRVLRYGQDYDGTMMGGNAVIRRSSVEKVGPFDPGLGRRGERLTTGEDADYHERLIASGAHGFYIPSLVIYHYIPPARMTKRYHRRWCFFRGISLAQIDRTRPQSVAYVLGIPRYMIGNAARGLLYIVRHAWRRGRDSEQVFTHELPIWDLAGFVYGKCFRRANMPGDATASASTGPVSASPPARA